MFPGVNELVLTVVIVALLFGATKAPKAVKYTGKTIHEYKKGKDEGEEGLRQIEHRIKEIEKQNAKRNATESIKKDLNNLVNKENIVMALGLLLIGSAILLGLNEQVFGRLTTGVVILLGVSGIALIAISKKLGRTWAVDL